MLSSVTLLLYKANKDSVKTEVASIFVASEYDDPTDCYQNLKHISYNNISWTSLTSYYTKPGVYYDYIHPGSLKLGCYALETTNLNLTSEERLYISCENKRIHKEFINLINSYKIEKILQVDPNYQKPLKYPRIEYKDNSFYPSKENWWLNIYNSQGKWDDYLGKEGLTINYYYNEGNYQIWSYENSYDSQVNYPTEDLSPEEKWAMKSNSAYSEEFKWVETNREVTSNYKNNEAKFYSYETFEEAEKVWAAQVPLLSSNPLYPRFKYAQYIKDCIFIYSKIFTLDINKEKSCKFPYLFFKDTNKVNILTSLLPNNISMNHYIKWDNLLHTTEIGFSFTLDENLNNFDLDKLLLVLNRLINVRTCNSLYTNESSKFKRKDLDNEIIIYLELNPEVLPNTGLVLQNFLHLRVSQFSDKLFQEYKDNLEYNPLGEDHTVVHIHKVTEE